MFPSDHMRTEGSNDLFEGIMQDAVARTRENGSGKTNLYIQMEVLPAGTSIEPSREKITFDRNTVMVFADDAPTYNWAHPCHYLLYDIEQREMRAIEGRLPPFSGRVPETFRLFLEQTLLPSQYPRLELYQDIKSQSASYGSSAEQSGNKYAILFSGETEHQHLNDIEFLYRTLINVYHYRKENIYVLNFDGTLDYAGLPQPLISWPGDNTAYRVKVTAEGTQAEMEKVLDDLKTRLRESDSLLIHTNGHGDHNGTDSELVGYLRARYTANDFASKLYGLPRFNRLMVMMEQCNSGGFVQPILAASPATLTSVATACEELRPSHRNLYFNPFARDWTAAMNGSNPDLSALAFDPDTDGNGGVTVHEAFSYALKLKHPRDVPQFGQSSASAGDCRLG